MCGTWGMRVYKVPRFWRRFQLLARPTVFFAMRRITILQRRGQIDVLTAHRLKAQIRARAA